MEQQQPVQEGGSKAVKTSVKVVKKMTFAKKLIALVNVKTIAISGVLVFGLVTVGAGISVLQDGGGNTGIEQSNIGLSPETLAWLDTVTEEAEAQGVPELIPYIMGIIQVETGGKGPDVMQSSESAGLGPNGFTNAADSIRQGISYLKSAMANAESNGTTDMWAVVQSYNFGTAYTTYLAENNKKHSLDVAEAYSRDVVAPSLGNTTGATNSYVNAVSEAHGKTYLYRNGGNYYYAELVKQYVGGGAANEPTEVFDIIMEEALKFEGDEYVWAGASPVTGFDCSGLMMYVFAQAGIQLPRTAVEQWGVTEEVSLEDARPGDLVFFKGTYGGADHISHVGIYVDETRMYDANGSGVGYHTWSTGYWRDHFDSIRRIK